jgi:hypothetical protein
MGAYLQMCIFYEKLWLFDTVVHERGKYTLLQVIFYFRHFLWEVPIKLVYSLFVVGAFYYYGKPVTTIDKSRTSDVPVKGMVISGVFALGLVLYSIFMAGSEIGFKDALMGLMQYRTHELRPLEFGSHWRNHFLSNIVLFCTSVVFILLYRRLNSNEFWIKKRNSGLFPVAIGIFVSLTLLFGFTQDPFVSPSYIGHQLREIFGTDLSVTLFLVMGTLIHLEKKYDLEQSHSSEKDTDFRKKNIAHIFYWAFPGAVCAGFLIIKVLTFDIGTEMGRLGNTNDWSVLDLFAWHFFEHSLDYIFSVSLVYCFYLLALKRESKRTDN